MKPGPVGISEFMADRPHGLRDEDGKLSGWIELYSSSGAPVNLDGWFLTNSRTNLTQWRFPTISLLPDKYLLVFASGENRTVNPSHLHTNFQLRPEGGFLALVNRSTNIVSEYSDYPAQSPGCSYGRVRGELSIVGSFTRPTPGKPNSVQPGIRRSASGVAPRSRLPGLALSI